MSAPLVHLHAATGPVDGTVPACPTVCGLSCDTVDTAYRGLDPERVTCPACAPEPPAPTFEEVREVADLLRGHGHAATVEWPGALVLPLAPGHDVWTGLHGWEYGTRNALDPDGACWQPMDEPAEVELRPGATPAEVAAAWHAFATEATATA